MGGERQDEQGTSASKPGRQGLEEPTLLCRKPSPEKGDGLVGAPAVAAFEEVQFEAVFDLGGGIDFFQFTVTAHRRVDKEAIIVRTDFDEEGAWGDETLEVGDVAEGEQAGGDL